MSTARRQQKYEKLFDSFDTDHDGQIGQLDVDGLVQRWCVALQIPPGAPAWNRITRKANRLWQDLIGHVDAVGDKQVSKEEWVKSHDQPGFIENAANPWAVGVFDIGDPKGDGRVSLQAWMTCQTVTGRGQAESLEMFLRLDEDRDGYVHRDEFVSYVERLYSCEHDDRWRSEDDRWWSEMASAVADSLRPSRSGSERLDLLEAFVSAVVTGDERKVLSLTSPDVEFRIMTVPDNRVFGEGERDLFRGIQRRVEGREQLATLVSSLALTFNSLSVRNFRGYGDGSGASVAAEFDAVGETALGNPYVNSSCGIAEFDGSGRITKYREYLDPGPLADVITDLLAATSRRPAG